MTIADIAKHRLLNQQITTPHFTKPEELVHWLVAMQAQEYAMAKWAIGLRVPGITDAMVEKAFNEGAILRTHLMRPTWHFVSPSDIRWLLALTAPRVHAFNAYYYRQQNLDKATFTRSHKALQKMLQGGKALDRVQIKSALDKAGIKTTNLGFSCILMHAELDGLICSGPRQGKQFTYMLLEERVPAAKKMDREEALVTLTRRYFTSRGPATVQDFAWWSGLTVKDGKEGLALLGKTFVSEIVNSQEYFLASSNQGAVPVMNDHATFLMPDYDEYGICYKNRSALAAPGTTPLLKQPGVTTYSHWLVVDGLIRGIWKPVAKKDSVTAETIPLVPLNKKQQAAIQKAVKKYIAFAGVQKKTPTKKKSPAKKR